MDHNEDDFIFYGTPIEREEDISIRKRKAIDAAGSLRSLPAWKQEVTDEEGRKRFHGAFTGGFSAGYYNTVGSKEGWTPQTFTSSRKNRAEVNKQSIYNFFDDEDIKNMGGQALETSLKFDTFGFTAAELARKQAERDQKNSLSVIPGPVPDEIIVPASNSVGAKLLLKMGWRRGHSIKESKASSLQDARREARIALLAFSSNVGGNNLLQTEPSQPDSGDFIKMNNDGLSSSQSTPAYVLNPKQDLYGLGYDPFKHAPEFKERKMLHESRKIWDSKGNVLMKGHYLASNSGKYAPGFGIGVLEELDVEDEDIYASGLELLAGEVEEDEPSRVMADDKFRVEDTKKGLPGFKAASSSDYVLKRFHPPTIPSDFKPYHKFASPLKTIEAFLDPLPPEAFPPNDNNVRLLIDGFANLVARCGKLFEDLSKEKNRSNPLFSFLCGGNGYDYYARKLWEAKHKLVNQENQACMESVVPDQKMTADIRGTVLGERPLERSFDEPLNTTAQTPVVHFQSNLSDTFTKPSALADSSEYAKPFNEDPAKQERFELFLKEKYHGGLRSTSSCGTDRMTEIERARERLDFEAAAEASAKTKRNKKYDLRKTQQSIGFCSTGDERFILSGGLCSKIEEKLPDNIIPKREEFQWRPSPLLCKRFDLVDPFMGKASPAPRPKSKMDALVFMTDFLMDSKSEVIINTNKNSSTAADKESLSSSQLETQKEYEPTLQTLDTDLPSDVQRPVDLYKAIFSDDSEKEDDYSFNSMVEPEKRSVGTNTTLNRIIAGDFLESLGKELGLEVPVDPLHSDEPNSISFLLSSNKPISAPKSSSGITQDESRIQESRPLETTGIIAYPSKSCHGNKDKNRKHRRHLSSINSDSSNSRGYDRSRSEKKARKHARHQKHKSNISQSRQSDDETDSGPSDEGKRDPKLRTRRHGHSSESGARKYC